MSTLNRVGSVSLLKNTMGDVADLQKQLGTLQQQISSGVKASTFQELNGQVEKYTLLESKIRRTDAFIEANAVTIGRLQTADQSITQMIDIADDMEDLIVNALDGAASAGLPVEQQMKNLLEAMAAALNVSFDGRYLFSGSATNTIPMPDSTKPPATAGVPDAGYYAGAPDSLSVRVDETSSFEFPVRADDAAFQQIYAAAHLALKAHANNSPADMRAALDLMQKGQASLNATRAEVNMTIINTEAVTERLESMSLYWKGVTEKVGKTDIVAATTQISSYEAVLQATFQVYARLSQLKLSDYL